MSDDQTPRLNLPYLAAGQAQKHVTLNEALCLIDGLVQASVASRSLAAQPGAPSDGAAYVLPSGRTGATWALYAVGSLLRFQDGVWTELAAPVGTTAWCVDEALPIVRTASGWLALQDVLSELQHLTRLGLGATADATNRVAVASPAVLFTNAGAGVQAKLNKAATGDTASVLFQKGFSGRAEVGLTGADQLSVKVSADGSTWRETLTATAAGRVGVNQASPAASLDVVNEDGTQPAASFSVFADSSAGVNLTGIKQRGTRASPTAVQAGDRLIAVYGRGWQSGGALGGNAAAFQLLAAEAFTSTAQGTSITFETTPAGSTTRRGVVAFQANGAMKLTPVSAAPAAPTAGELYFDSTLGKFRGYTGSAWADLH